MKPPIARQGRWVPLLIFAVVLAVAVVALSTVALGETAETAALSPNQTTVFTVSATDLGEYADDPPTITSPAAILVHADSGKVLYERRADKQLRMASTTKIMTAILILENMDLSTPVTVSAKAAQTVEPKTWLREGDVLTVEQLLYALMVRSANSAAVALAEACSGVRGSVRRSDEPEGCGAGDERHAFRQPQRLGCRRPLFDRSGHGPRRSICHGEREVPGDSCPPRRTRSNSPAGLSR